VHIHGLIDDRIELESTAKLTGVITKVSTNTCAWRGVTTCEESNKSSGWATLDVEDNRPEQTALGCSQIYAFFLLSIEPDYHFLLKHLFKKVVAYRVLYLKAIEITGFEGRYERVGVGRLFGDEAYSLFQATSESEIWLT
jgi:hypothetical protein